MLGRRLMKVLCGWMSMLASRQHEQAAMSLAGKRAEVLASIAQQPVD